MKKISSYSLGIAALIGMIALPMLMYSGKIQPHMDHPNSLDSLPVRSGTRPRTTPTNPHMQLTQQPTDLSHITHLMNWAFELAHIEKQPSGVSVPGAIAMCMEEGHTCQSCNAFMIGNEFAHFHPHPDYSLHLGLPEQEAEVTIQKGWGEWHPLSERGFLPKTIIMLYAPRDEEELTVAKQILKRSYAFAKGELKSLSD